MKLILDDNRKPIQAFAYSTHQEIDGSSASAQSTALTGTLVRLATYANAVNVLFGSNPTATDTSVLIPASTVEYVKITSGQKVAAKNGKLSVTILS